MARLFIPVLLTLLISACGGGSSGSDSAPPTSPAPVTPPPDDGASPVITQNSLELYGNLEAQTGEAVGFVVKASSGISINSIDWSTSSADLALLASHTQAIGFDAPAAGDYVFNVTASLSNGVTAELDFTLTVIESTAEKASIRLDHVASEQGRVSLRVDNNSDKDISTIDWELLFGPSPTELSFGSDVEDGPTQSIFFAAPTVAEDEVMVYQATISFTDGSTLSDTAMVLVKDITINSNGYFPNSADLIVTTDLIPYRANSPFASVLQDCVYNNDIESSCTFSRLPLIGQQTESPTIDDILNRTLVSHPWMGDSFKQFLETSASSSDMLDLLRATTAIVISYDIRPSFYWVATGAIYLDAANFWQTPEQRDTLNTAPDFRSDFGNSLQFIMPWRYVRDDVYYFPQRTLTAASRQVRTPAQTEAAITWLMYHELAHANDFFDYTKWAGLSGSDDPLSNFRSTSATSSTLEVSFPLTSSQMHGLAQVAFAGDTPTATQRNYSPEDVRGFFIEDDAPAFYSYFTEREDFATLFERFMMLYRLGVSADVGIIANDTEFITWAQRDRIADPALRSRATFTVSRILPDLDTNQIFNNFPLPQAFDQGISWFDFAAFESVPQQRNAIGNDIQIPLKQARLAISDHPTWRGHTIKIPQ